MIELSSEQLVVAHDFGLYAKKKYHLIFLKLIYGNIFRIILSCQTEVFVKTLIEMGKTAKYF